MLACEDRDELERELQAWCDRLERFGLKLNVKKTEYLTTDRHGDEDAVPAGVTRMDRIRSDDIQQKFGVARIAEKMSEAHLRCYGHVLRGKEDSARKRGHLKVAGVRPDLALDRERWRHDTRGRILVYPECPRWGIGRDKEMINDTEVVIDGVHHQDKIMFNLGAVFHVRDLDINAIRQSTLLNVTIDDCTSPFRWVWVATCTDQVVQNERYIVCEFGTLPEGSYRLGYFSHYSNCLTGLSKSFRVTEQPTS
ncbi:unnamed protein product [Heligmosomoides polygyrus]|uniref:Reverse transcriptase domain-containing protein n=1 Tax=Heligmosomoides polygyrus TaxID=6339 RepID=A0A183GF57_HELPZ|nr:unnamed protein product [Heligmosomoides polygyrus]